MNFKCHGESSKCKAGPSLFVNFQTTEERRSIYPNIFNPPLIFQLHLTVITNPLLQMTFLTNKAQLSRFSSENTRSPDETHREKVMFTWMCLLQAE